MNALPVFEFLLSLFSAAGLVRLSRIPVDEPAA